MDRRGFLRSVAALGTARLLSACGTDTAVPSTEPTLSVFPANYELLTGRRQRVAFALLDASNRPLRDAPAELYVRDPQGGVLSGPVDTDYHREPGLERGFYRSTVTLRRPGVVTLAAVVGDAWGEGAVRVVTPRRSAVPAPGQPAVETATPTPAHPVGMRRLCTRTPPCGMHATSLDDALAAHRPVVLTFATPAYCTSTVCGPTVDTVERVRTSTAWGDVAWIHCEIFSDAGRHPARPVRAWGLESEPWLFAIGRDGIVADRLDGPVLEGDVARSRGGPGPDQPASSRPRSTLAPLPSPRRRACSPVRMPRAGRSTAT
ncbi:MAG: hypothetical protein M3N17_02835 [Actinomycetota bacterium]|nr:hypothetical protein [Actinomycetota bacterium]